MLVTRKSVLTGNTSTRDIHCTLVQMHQWLDDVPIQYAMPNTTESEREFLITGITEDEWSLAFNSNEV